MNNKLDYTVHLSSFAYISELTGPLLVRDKMKTLWSSGTLHDQLYLHVLSHRLPNLVNMALHYCAYLFGMCSAQLLALGLCGLCGVASHDFVPPGSIADWSSA